MKNAWILLAVLPGLLLATGCVSYEEDINQKEEEVVLAGTRLWNLSDFSLRVCFLSQGNGSLADKQMVRDAVENSWAQVRGTKVSFTYWGSCLNSVGSDIRIFLDSTVPISDSVVGTEYRDTNTQMNLELPAAIIARQANPAFVYMHEFGHALGLLHEQQHLQTPADCRRYAPEPRQGDAVDLTGYDHYALMNYCEPSDPPVLTDRDELFAQLMYPDEFAQFSIACKNGCFSGQGRVVLRTTGVAQNEFSARGAVDWWETSGGFGMSWWADQDDQQVGSGADVAASSLQAEEQFVDFSARVRIPGVNPDASDARFVIGGGTVIVSDAKWTSVLSGLL